MLPDNLAYRAAFEAIELMAASANIDMRHLHHRYHASTAVKLLRKEAARLLRMSRAYDRDTAAKVRNRHRSQVIAR
jgi:hypothetical protein